MLRKACEEYAQLETRDDPEGRLIANFLDQRMVIIAQVEGIAHLAHLKARTQIRDELNEQLAEADGCIRKHHQSSANDAAARSLASSSVSMESFYLDVGDLPDGKAGVNPHSDDDLELMYAFTSTDTHGIDVCSRPCVTPIISPCGAGLDGTSVNGMEHAIPFAVALPSGLQSTTLGGHIQHSAKLFPFASSSIFVTQERAGDEVAFAR